MSEDEDGRVTQAMRDRMTCRFMEINQSIHEGFAALNESMQRGLDEDDEGDE